MTGSDSVSRGAQKDAQMGLTNSGSMRSTSTANSVGEPDEMSFPIISVEEAKKLFPSLPAAIHEGIKEEKCQLIPGDDHDENLIGFQFLRAKVTQHLYEEQLAEIRQRVDDENAIQATQVNVERMREKMADAEVFTKDQFEQSLGVLAGCLSDIRGLFK